jgi:hypothetical protein
MNPLPRTTQRNDLRYRRAPGRWSVGVYCNAPHDRAQPSAQDP